MSGLCRRDGLPRERSVPDVPTGAGARATNEPHTSEMPGKRPGSWSVAVSPIRSLVPGCIWREHGLACEQDLAWGRESPHRRRPTARRRTSGGDRSSPRGSDRPIGMPGWGDLRTRRTGTHTAAERAATLKGTASMSISAVPAWPRSHAKRHGRTRPTQLTNDVQELGVVAEERSGRSPTIKLVTIAIR